MNEVGRDWHNQLNLALWAYRTSICTPIGDTPYSLVYGSKAILPIEFDIPSLRVSLQGLIQDEDYRVKRLQELELMDEHLQYAFDHLKAYKKCMCQRYNHKVNPRPFQIGELTLKENPCNQQDWEKKGKVEPNWLGPFVIISTYRSGAYQLSTSEGDLFDEPINNVHLKKFYT